jgi:hypothetical protein
VNPLLCAAAIVLAGCAGCYKGNESATFACVMDGSLTAEQRASVEQAIDDWGTATDGRFFCAYDSKQEGLSVVTFHAAPPPEGELGHTHWSDRAGIVTADVVIEPRLTAEQTARVARHEIGHVLRIRFDGQTHYQGAEPSMMHVDYESNSPRIEAVDIEAFRETWEGR